MTSGTTFSAISRWWTRCSVACGITATRWPSTVLRCANCRAELMDGRPIDPRDYVRRLLEAYRATPGTSGAVHRADRLLAARLHERGVPLEAVENAFVLAATRRIIRPAGAGPLGTIRSLAYFSPVIEEVLQLQVSQEYFQYLRHKLQRAASGTIAPIPSPE